MNVTILVGNGFDLNLNLKTQYTDFIKDYCKIQKVIIKSSKSSKRILRKIVKIGQMLNLLSVNILRTFRPKITVLKNSVIATKIFVENLHCI